jgi:outer membrane protein TolC
MHWPVFITLLFLSFPASLRGETVNLDQALLGAISRRPLAVAAKGDAAAARAAADEARSLYLPRVMLSETFSWTDEPAGSLFIDLNQEDLALSQDADSYNFPPSRRDFETRVSVEQPLFNPDISYGSRRAEEAARAADAEAEWSIQQAAFAVLRSYLDLQRAHAALESSRSSERETAEMLRLSDERYRAGTGLKADQLRAKVALTVARRRVRAAENDLELARRSLALNMGRAGEAVDIAAPLTPELFAEEGGQTMLRRNDLAALGHRSREAELAAEQSRNRYLPRADLGASYSLHDADAPFGTDAGSWKVGARLSWELFDGGSRKHAVARSDAGEQATRQRWLEAAQQARFRVEEARLRAEEARLNLEAARQSVAEGAESRSQIEQRYQAGLIDLTALLAVQAALDRSRFDLTAATTDLILSLGRIHYEQGTLIEALLPDMEVQP